MRVTLCSFRPLIFAVSVFLLTLALHDSVSAQQYQGQDANNAPSNRNDDDRSDSSGPDLPERGTESRIFGPTIVQDPLSSPQLLPYDRLRRAQLDLLSSNSRLKDPPEPGEFATYVERVIGRELPRYGEDLLLPESRDFSAPATAAVPPDYRLNVGDTISISLAGAVDGSVEREIDTNGNIFLPSVGTVHLAGVRHGDLLEVLANAIGLQYRNFRVGVRLKDLKGIRVYVTGYANNPGMFSVASLSTIANAVFQAGGPSTGGSFRHVKLIRNGHEIIDFDLYELLKSGNRVHDAVLENEDVLFIPPAGRQVAVIGSVNQEAIYELRSNETIADLIDLAGGITPLGDTNRVILYSATDQSRIGPQEIPIDRAEFMMAQAADILQALPQGSLLQPVARQSVVVRIEGEVAKPGNYFVAPGTPLGDIVAMAGGLTDRAFPFGAKFTRQSVAAQQQQGFEDAVDQFEMTLASAPLTADSSIEASKQQAQLAGAREVLEKLRKAEPDGRLVLNIDPNAKSLPSPVVMENGDRIVIPPRPSSIGVFGAVYRPASFMIDGKGKKIEDYLDQAGGAVRAADKGNIFVVRANGEVVPKSRGALRERALPGDVVFVPVKTSSKDILDKIAQITSIIFQFGLSAATVAAID